MIWVSGRSLSLVLQQGHFLKVSAIVQRCWKCGCHARPHFLKRAILNLTTLVPLMYPFPMLLYILVLCSHVTFMTKTYRNDEDASSYRTHTHQPISSPYLCTQTQCHLITDGFMCLFPPMGREIVLFLSGGQLIFY